MENLPKKRVFHKEIALGLGFQNVIQILMRSICLFTLLLVDTLDKRTIFFKKIANKPYLNECSITTLKK